MEKVVLIGPVYPYKGGISHYTSLMYQALAKSYDVTMVSYSLQYPKLLFKKEQKDYENNSFQIKKTNYWLNTANPVNWVVTAEKIRDLRSDFVIIQWWHPYFAPCYRVLTSLLKKEKIIFVCHNVYPHERFVLDRFLTRLALNRGNGFIVQSQTDALDLKTAIPAAIFRQTVHPTYNAFQFLHLSKEEARAELEIPDKEKILLFFGFVREYKGLKYLIEALPKISEAYPDICLFIVGDFGIDKAEYEKLISSLRMEAYIRIYDGYIPDQKVEPYFAACDLVVLPYISATQSGIVQIAYGFEKPVIVTNVGGLPDVVADGKNGYVVEAGDPQRLAEAVIAYFRDEKESEFIQNVQNEAYRFSWDRMTETVKQLSDDIDKG